MKIFILTLFIFILFCQNVLAHNQSYFCKGYDYSGIEELKVTELFIQLNEENYNSVIKLNSEEFKTKFNYKIPVVFISNFKLKNIKRKSKFCECNINLDLNLKLNKAKSSAELSLNVSKYDITLLNRLELREYNHNSCNSANETRKNIRSLIEQTNQTLTEKESIELQDYNCLSEKYLFPENSRNKPFVIKGRDYCDNACSIKTSINMTCKTF